MLYPSSNLSTLMIITITCEKSTVFHHGKIQKLFKLGGFFRLR